MKTKIFIASLLLICICHSMTGQEAKTTEEISLRVKNDPEMSLAIGKTSSILHKSMHRGFVSTAVDLAANLASRAIFSAFDNISAKRQVEWKTPVVKDYFYDSPSTFGALDPTGMRFSGILMSREMIASDTSSVFHLECSVPSDDRSVTNYITNSRFEMRLDSLAIDLSKVKARYTSRKRISIQIDIAIRATWIDDAMNIHSDQELGLFRISLPNMRYDPKKPIVTFGGEQARKMLNGFCFFIPRSHGAFVSGGKYQECWSAGEFEVQMTIRESTAVPKKAGATYAYEYLQKALPGSLSSISVNENIVGPGVVKIIKGY